MPCAGTVQRCDREYFFPGISVFLTFNSRFIFAPLMPAMSSELGLSCSQSFPLVRFNTNDILGKGPCLESCPMEAIFRNQLGIVLNDNELCIGCRECLEACPFGAMQFDADQEVAVKCDLCLDRLQNNQRPACVKPCTTQCIFGGDTRALHKRIDREI